MKYFSEFIQKLIRPSTHHCQSIHLVSRLHLEWFWRYYADKISSILFQRAITQERGIILMGKNMSAIFFMKNSNMKFQNSSIHGSEVMLCIKKHAMQKCLKLQRAITHEVFFRIYSKVNDAIYVSVPIYSLGFKPLALMVFVIFCYKDFINISSKSHNSEKGHNLDEKKVCFTHFLHKESIYEISKP